MAHAPDAKYAHATLFHLGARATQAVISQFNHAVSNPAARCWFDPQENAFNLTCPGTIGAVVNETLHRIITGYVESEPERANEEEREPEIFRFAESDIDNLDPHDPHSFSRQMAFLQALDRSKDNITLHSVIGESTTTTSLFSLCRISNGMVERTLTSAVCSAQDFELALACRAVKWDAAKHKYIFNGRTGAPIEPDKLKNAKSVLDSTEFMPIYDRRPEAEVVKSKTFRFEGRVPSVQAFAAGEGIVVSDDIDTATTNDPAITIEDPNEVEPEWSSDARRFYKSPTIQRLNTGESDDESDVGSVISDGDFMDLLKNKEPAKEASNGESSLNEQTGTRSSAPQAAVQQLSFVTNSQRAVSIEGLPPPIRTPAKSAVSLQPETVTVQHVQSYGNKYERIDERGLTSHANAQAQWEHENASPRKAKAKNGGISKRPSSRILLSHPASASSAAMTFSNGTEFRPAYERSALESSSSEFAATTIHRFSGSQLNNVSWLNKNVPAHVESRNLIDDSPHDGGSPDEIVERVQATSNLQQAPKYTMRQQKGKGRKAASNRSKSTATPKVELPKPDAVPPPRKKQPGFPKAAGDPFSAPASTVKSAPVARQDLSDSLVTESPPLTALDKFLEQTQAMHSALTEPTSSSHHHDVASPKLEIRFGTILSRPLSGEELGKGVYEPLKMEKKLNNSKDAFETTFLPRLTTADSDASFILELVSGDDIHSSVEYELHLKKSDGDLGIVRLDQKTCDWNIWIPDSELGKLFLHYPVRVWDAVATVVKRATDPTLSESVKELLATMQSFEALPSFLAYVSSNKFAIEKVYAKRNFRKMITHNIALQVTEVQELEISTVSLPFYNIKAAAGPNEEMIKEHRLWWEAKLHCDNLHASSTAALQDLVTELVCNMDGVGYHNQGPWVRNESQLAPFPESVESQPLFW